MNIDSSGLPVTVFKGVIDKNDQLQRCAMIVAAGAMDRDVVLNNIKLCGAVIGALKERLQVKPGVYTRFIGGDTDNVSADQLVSALAAHVALGNTKQVLWMFIRMIQRLGFAQNYRDGLSGKEKIKTPDFMLLRSLPLFARISRWLYPIATVLDLLLIFAAISAIGPVWRDDKGFSKRGPNDVDDNVTILTLSVCRFKYPTPLSWLASKVYGRLRPYNHGCAETANLDSPVGPIDLHPDTYHPVYGSLRWYHRAQSGGNPEIAEMWKPICERYFE